MSIIKVENVSKIYGKNTEVKVQAVNNVSFSVEKGEFVCIVGASGSGKSTLMHLIAGVDQVTSGNIFVNGQDITQLNKANMAEFRRSKIGIVYQFFNLVPVLSAKENIELPLLLGGEKIDNEYFNLITEILGIKERLTFYPNQLSGGEQQRVAIARALIHKPDIILADEPTGNLNSVLAKEIMEFLVKACYQFHQTIIMITHDLNLAQYANRIIEVQDGKIISDSKNSYINMSDLYEEGLDEKSRNYVLYYDSWNSAIKRMYELDQHSLKTLNQSAKLIDELESYYQHLKAAINSNFIIFIENNEVRYVFKKKEELISYIYGLDAMTEQRKKELINFLDCN